MAVVAIINTGCPVFRLLSTCITPTAAPSLLLSRNVLHRSYDFVWKLAHFRGTCENLPSPQLLHTSLLLRDDLLRRLRFRPSFGNGDEERPVTLMGSMVQVPVVTQYASKCSMLRKKYSAALMPFSRQM
jgi:hypothetical protein